MQWPDWMRFEPITSWPGTPTPGYARKRSPFSAAFSSTLATFRRELDHLGASRIVMQVALSERDIRVDGYPRANARAFHPGVVVTFTRPAKSKMFNGRYAAENYLRQIGGVDGAASVETLYRRAVMACHPDRGGDEATFRKVAEAYRLLTQPDTLQFAIDTYETWQDNLRAIALGLEALRRVERYGITQGDEHLSGFKQLTAGSA